MSDIDLPSLPEIVRAFSPVETGQSDESHCVYIVRLSDDVLTKKRFAQANPDRKPDTWCLYVGMTGLTPEERFENHKSNYKASRWVRDYGIELMPELYEPLNRMSYDAAQRIERELAGFLRTLGFAVWQK